MVKNWTINLFLLVSLVGVLDAGYLTISHFQGSDTGCFLLKGCDVVLSSQYSEFFGVPAALFGFLFYLVIFVGVLVYNFKRNNPLIKLVSKLTSIGFLATLWFLYLQVFVLKAYCSYCLLSATTSILLFILGLYVFNRTSRFAVEDKEMLELEGS